MLGDVVQQQKQDCVVSEPSILLMSEIQDLWKEERDVIPATLVKQDEKWREFWLYASDTKNWCPRACALRAMMPVAPRRHKVEDLWNFGQGHAYHDLFQQNILQSLGDRFLGTWERFVMNNGAHSYRKDSVTWDKPDFVDEESRKIVNPWVSRPEGEGWKYVEPKIRMMDHRVVMKIDGIIRAAESSAKEIFELKTARQQMRDLRDPMLGGSPRPEHVEQVNLEMWGTGIRTARIVYLFKGDFKFGLSTVEHEVEYDEALVDRLKGVANECVAAVKFCDAIKADRQDDEPVFSDDKEAAKWMDENFPRLSDCPMKSKGRARYCPFRDACFPGRGKKRK